MFTLAHSHSDNSIGADTLNLKSLWTSTLLKFSLAFAGISALENLAHVTCLRISKKGLGVICEDASSSIV